MIDTVILFVIFIKLARQIVQNVSFISITHCFLGQILMSLKLIKCIIYNKYQGNYMRRLSFRIERQKVESFCVTNLTQKCEDDFLNFLSLSIS